MCSGDKRLYRSQDDPRIRASGPRGGEVTEPDSDELEPGALVGGELGRLAHKALSTIRHHPFLSQPDAVRDLVRHFETDKDRA